MRPIRTAAVLAMLLLLLPRWAAAQELRVDVSADTVTVGERFRITVAADHDFAAPATFPDPTISDSLVFGDVEVIRRIGSGTASTESGRVDSVTYEVTTFALDTALVAPVPILFTAGEDTFTVRTDAALVPVASLVPPDAEDVRDLAPLVEFPVSIWRYVLAAAAILLLAAVIAFLLWRHRRRKRESAPPPPPEPPIPPDVEAFQRLDALETTDISTRDAVKLFYVELSDTLRTYLSRRLDVHALERTTGELVSELRGRSTPDEETTGRIRNILVQSDYVKFADAEPAAEESRRLLSSTRNVVETIERQFRPAADPETVLAQGPESPESDPVPNRPRTEHEAS